jgi:tyrosyl-tRNA synthetase
MNYMNQLDIISRGTEEIISAEELGEKLATGRSLTVKVGFDPTAPDLHLGHTVLLQKMRHFQDLGHKVYFLIGDFTGMIGDPSGKSETRKALSREEVLANAETYKEQVFKVLLPEQTEVAFNSQWLTELGSAGIVRLASNFTVARMLERDDFEKRYKSGLPISIHEFMYPLLQGYDSVHLKADVEMGGTDQKFNLLVGRELQRAYGQKPQSVITVPILEGMDGVNKMSKSLHNYVGITDAPESMFGKLMSITDELMFRYYLLLSNLSMTEIEKLKAEVAGGIIHPMDVKKRLAEEIITRYHSADDARQARENFERVFSRRENPEDMTEYKYSKGTQLMDIILGLKFSDSRNEAKRLCQQGGVYLDGETVSDLTLTPEGDAVLKVGKRKFAKIRER